MPDLFPDRTPDRTPDRVVEQTAARAPTQVPEHAQNPPDRLGQVLGALYDANESIAGSVISAGLSLVPGVDQVLDAGDLALNVWRVTSPEHRGDPEAITNLALTGIGAAIPVVGDALEAGLKVVMRGGPRAAAALAETVGPLLRARGINPVEFFERQARAVPGTLDRAVAGVTETVGSFLDRAGRSRFGVPDWVERAAREAAGEMRSAGTAARRAVQGVADEIASAFRSLAAAAGGRRAAGHAAGDAAGDARRGAHGARAATGGPEPPRRTGSDARAAGDLARRVERVTSVDELRDLARLGGSRTERMVAEGNPREVFGRLAHDGHQIAQDQTGRIVWRTTDGTILNLHRGSGAVGDQTNYWTVGVRSPGSRVEEKFRFARWPSTGPSPLQ